MAFTDAKGLGYTIQLLAPPLFLTEALFIFEADLTTRIPITEELMALAGLAVERTQLTDEEISLYIDLAQEVDDGEAQSLAIAILRGLPFLSDDDAGLRIAKEHRVKMVTTLDLAYDWSNGRHQTDVREACRRLRLRARYGVPRRHAHAAWYLSHLDPS
jgi:predicted nucleic acid-binding protein